MILTRQGQERVHVGLELYMQPVLIYRDPLDDEANTALVELYYF